MRFIRFMAMTLMLALTACSNLWEESSDDSDTTELTIRKKVKGTISTQGEVDWYRFQANEVNGLVQVRCTSETLRPDVDLLVSLYTMNDQGRKVLLQGDHAPEGGLTPADLTLYTHIDRPRDLYISVRDLMDDDCSDNPYYISVDMESAGEENDSFATATAVPVNGGETEPDHIGSVGDMDCFSFTSPGAIYDSEITFDPFPGTPVDLSIDMYGSDGVRIDSRTLSGPSTLHMTHYLPAGDYYLHVHDRGMDDFDTASTYTVAVNTITGGEMHGNDTSQTADIVTLSAWDTDHVVNGAIDYQEDQDWYSLTLPAPLDGFRVIDIYLNAFSQQAFTIQLFDADLNPLVSKTIQGGAALFHVLANLPPGNAYLLIEPAEGVLTVTGNAAYSATLQVKNVLDPADTPPNENGTIDTADPLTPSADPSQAVTGKIAFRGDADWYSLTLPPHADPRVMEVFVEAPLSKVAYALTVISDQVEEKIYNPYSETRATRLNYSVLVPPDQAPRVYSFRVGDFQDDDGDDVTYTIRANVVDIPSTLPGVASSAPAHGAPVVYSNEADESSSNTITLEYNPVLASTFDANDTLLDFTNAVIEENTPQPGQTRVTFPWIAGYIDYQGDQDWFKIDMDSPDGAAVWYADLSVAFYAPATHVEYVWKFYPDRNDNNILAEQSHGADGFIASAGDTTLVEAPMAITTPAPGDDPFWINHTWAGQAFFSISDFNYIENGDGYDTPLPDDDWGGYGTAPYYFRLTLVFHAGASHP